ncbi:MAG TPA: hypothetical protein VJV05_15380 [Pyrinomonadaceae bacterium]|nr:hypothetical protein [Pyrinomonadaceae bacterium]
MTYRPLILGLFLLVSTSAALGCINPIGSSTIGGPISIDGLNAEESLTRILTHPGKAYWLQILAKLKIEETPSNRYDRTTNKTNTAVAMLHLGMVGKAIKILEEIERTDPGRYYTAANLGTAYELNGEDAKALEWIREGITRNADAHNGSEWLHVKILEAKLSLAKDPNWLTNNSVIGVHRISNEQLLMTGDVTAGNLGRPIDLNLVEKALIYQLHERLEFIEAPEGVVANLLYDLSRILARTRGPEHATIVRAFAQSYGPDLMPWAIPDPPLPAVTLPPRPLSAYWMAGGVVLLIAFGGVVILLQRRRQT